MSPHHLPLPSPVSPQSFIHHHSINYWNNPTTIHPSDLLGKHLRTLLQNLLHDRNLACLLAIWRSGPQTQGNYQLPLRKRPIISSVSWRACIASLSQWRRTLHCMQVVRGGVSGTGDYYWCWGTRGWSKEDDTIWYWYDQMHLLWICKWALLWFCLCATTY